MSDSDSISYNSIFVGCFHCDIAASSAECQCFAAGCVVYSGGFLGGYLPSVF